MELRKRLIDLWLMACCSVRELAARFEVSPKTVYKWIQRYEEAGLKGLEDRSHARHSMPERVSADTRERILALKRRYPLWGPKLLQKRLVMDFPEHRWPAASTVGELLKREGLVRPRVRKARVWRTPQVPRGEVPNEIWCVDFKGQWRLGDGVYCYPFTLSDEASRFVLRIDGYPSIEAAGVKRSMERAFREFGLPEGIRSDIGSPFAAPAGRLQLSALSVWWLSLGIAWLRNRPGVPQDNGVHERMHRELLISTLEPVAANPRVQQKRFDAFRREHNKEKPHGALDYELPAKHYRASTKPFPGKLPELEYPNHFELRKVSPRGEIGLAGTRAFLSEALAGRIVGAEQLANGWKIYFGRTLLAFVLRGSMEVIAIH